MRKINDPLLTTASPYQSPLAPHGGTCLVVGAVDFAVEFRVAEYRLDGHLASSVQLVAVVARE
jgi:hypothetical protein